MISPQSPALHLVLIRHPESLHNRDGEAGLDADAAGLHARRGRDGKIIFTESRIRL